MNKPQPTPTTPALKPDTPAINSEAIGDPLVIRHKPGQPFAPLPAQNCQPFAPPIEDKETSYRRIKNQETHSAEAAGVCTRRENPTPPRLERILPEDLGRMSRLEQLFIQAAQRGWFVPSEANALNFLAAAARATLVGYDPPRLFAGLVRRGLWSHITQAQEDLARTSLMRYRQTHPDAFRVSDPPVVSARAMVPEWGIHRQGSGRGKTNRLFNTRL